MCFKLKLIRRDKKGNYIPIKGRVNKKDIIILNTYTSNSEIPNFTKCTTRFNGTDSHQFINNRKFQYLTFFNRQAICTKNIQVTIELIDIY